MERKKKQETKGELGKNLYIQEIQYEEMEGEKRESLKRQTWGAKEIVNSQGI